MNNFLHLLPWRWVKIYLGYHYSMPGHFCWNVDFKLNARLHWQECKDRLSDGCHESIVYICIFAPTPQCVYTLKSSPKSKQFILACRHVQTGRFRWAIHQILFHPSPRWPISIIRPWTCQTPIFAHNPTSRNFLNYYYSEFPRITPTTTTTELLKLLLRYSQICKLFE